MNDDTLQKSLLEELGYTDVPAEKAKELETKALEVLQMRIGLRLSQDLTDEQLDELEQYMPTSEDSLEQTTHKQEVISDWLKQNHPNYNQVVTEEIQKLKQDLSGVSLSDLSTAL